MPCITGWSGAVISSSGCVLRLEPNACRALSNPRGLYSLEFRPLGNEVQLAVSGNADTVRRLKWEFPICPTFKVGNPAKKVTRVMQLEILAQEVGRFL
jgi:hypothetical protein